MSTTMTERKFSFISREEMVSKLAEFFAQKYYAHLEFWSATAMDDPEELCYWQQKMQEQPGKAKKLFEEAINNALVEFEGRKFRFFRRRLWIDTKEHNQIYQNVLKILEPGLEPRNCFPINMQYFIEGLDFFEVYHANAD